MAVQIRRIPGKGAAITDNQTVTQVSRSVGVVGASIISLKSTATGGGGTKQTSVTVIS